MSSSSDPAPFDYQTYLQSEEWKERRGEALAWATHRCQICNTNSQLHVHHRTYDRLGAEDLADLTVLCEECHERHHKMITCPVCGARVATTTKGQG